MLQRALQGYKQALGFELVKTYIPALTWETRSRIPIIDFKGATASLGLSLYLLPST